MNLLSGLVLQVVSFYKTREHIHYHVIQEEAEDTLFVKIMRNALVREWVLEKWWPSTVGWG